MFAMFSDRPGAAVSIALDQHMLAEVSMGPGRNELVQTKGRAARVTSLTNHFAPTIGTSDVLTRQQHLRVSSNLPALAKAPNTRRKSACFVKHMLEKRERLRLQQIGQVRRSASALWTSTSAVSSNSTIAPTRCRTKKTTRAL